MKSCLVGFGGDFIIVFRSGLYFQNGRWSAKGARYLGRRDATGMPSKNIEIKNPKMLILPLYGKILQNSQG